MSPLLPWPGVMIALASRLSDTITKFAEMKIKLSRKKLLRVSGALFKAW